MIEYVDRDGVITERVIEPLNIYRIAGKATIYIDAFCTVRNAMRSFRNDRILSARDMQNNQEIANLGRYLWERY
nr:WYL domain-containing protein [uncultured Bartonella sp.]